MRRETLPVKVSPKTFQEIQTALAKAGRVAAATNVDGWLLINMHGVVLVRGEEPRLVLNRPEE